MLGGGEAKELNLLLWVHVGQRPVASPRRVSALESKNKPHNGTENGQNVPLV